MKVDIRLTTFVFVACLLLLPGCDGCRRQSAPPDQPDAVPASEFTAASPVCYPADQSLPAGGMKPGHWFTASQSIKANLGDRRGQLRSFLTLPIVNELGMATGRSATSAMQSIRPVVLPKGQQRQFEYRLLAPLPNGTRQTRAVLQSRLELSGQVSSFAGNAQPYQMLAPQEFFFVILTERGDRFARLKVADWVRPITAAESFAKPDNNYRVVIPPTGGLMPMPETMLDLSATAVVLWDDVPPENLTPDQWTALSDWLHFGGRLIINGSDASEAIQQSVLAPWLPWKPIGNLELTNERPSELLKRYSVTTDRSVEKQIALVGDGTARILLEGQLHRDAAVIPECGGLFATRQIGRGQIIQSRCDLTSDWMSTWESYDSFFNGVLLGRPARRILPESGQFSESFLQSFVEVGQGRSLPMINTGFRLASRDAAVGRGEPATGNRDIASNNVGKGDDANEIVLAEVATPGSPFRSKPYSGIAGWSDNSDIVLQARESLRQQAGIEIPSIRLVARALAVYLAFLVPLNYLVFRIAGRLEYAWFAVPVIAIIGAVAVARMARLDIGFARSQNEIALLELQPGYSRGHLTRVVAIYNSLSTSYEVEFDTVGAVASPIGVPSTREAGTTGFNHTFRTSPAGGPALSGFAIDSNRIGMLHSEQVLDIEGGLSLSLGGAEMGGAEKGASGGNVETKRADIRLRNDTPFDVTDCVIVRRGESVDSGVSVAFVGQSQAGTQSRLRFKDVNEIELPEPSNSAGASLWRSLLRNWSLDPGESRLIGRMSNRLPGMSIQPAATQISGETVLIAHLRHAPAPAPQRDANLLGDFRRVRTELPGDAPTPNP